MGLFSKMKEFFSSQKYIFSAMADMDKRNAAYAAMTTEELCTLSDDELVSAVLYRTDRHLDTLLGKKKKGSPAEWAELLTDARRVAFILSYFESDVQTGGLEYFLKRNGGLAPSVSFCLNTIGAAEHQALYDGWISAHGLGLTYSEFLEYQDELSAFDQAYRQLPPMEAAFAPYLRDHLAEF